jgi:hypothetical protein
MEYQKRISYTRTAHRARLTTVVASFGSPSKSHHGISISFKFLKSFHQLMEQ